MPQPVRVRIAPSPTGDPHVGTAYMALFNRALADKRGGQFIFRLDDTDQKRRNEDSERQLFEALDWLGLRFDEGPHIGGPHAPYRQSERLAIHWGYVQKLLDAGCAYRCFCTADRLDAVRKIAAKEGRSTSYDRKCRELSPAEAKAKMDAGESWTVRVKMPLTGDVAFDDLLRGVVKFPAAELDDKVIWKADGFPTYHLANISDDNEFGITHIIRGEEWLSSVPTHIVMMEGLKLKRPVMIHMPLLRNADKSKVSKRKNPTSLLWFRDCGFLPEGMKNFLGLMGYALPGDQEVFTYDEFVKHFEPERINVGGPVFDLQKLEWCNGEHMRRLSEDEYETRLVAHIKRLIGREADFAPLPPDDPAHQQGTFVDKFRLKALERNRVVAAQGARWLENREMLHKLVPLIRERTHTLSEAADYLPPFFEEMPAFPKADFDEIKKFTAEEKIEAVKLAIDILEHAGTGQGVAFETKALEEALRKATETRGWKVGPPFMAVRLAALRAKISPPLFESMIVLGRDLSLKRLRAAAQAL